MGRPKRPTMHVAVMGVTGAGKSTFIQTASGIPSVGIGHDLHSYTETVESYSFDVGGVQVNLIDTPGFNDTELNESDVLKAIADWLDFNYRNIGQKLSGIIYLQSIMEPRMTGSSLRNLKMFKELCGIDPLKNVLLVTTRWGVAKSAGQLELAEQKEHQLGTDPLFWAKLIKSGANMDRFEDTQESALTLIMRLRHTEPMALQIQSEMVDQDKQLAQTSAGITVNEEILALEKKYQQEMQDLQKELEEARIEQDHKLQEALEEAREESHRRLDQVYRQQDALHYARRAEDRRVDEELQDLRASNQDLRALLDRIGAQQMDFDDTVAKLEANGNKLRREQRDAMQHEIDDMKKKPVKQRTVWKLLLRILPIIGSIAFALIGVPIAPGMLGGLFGWGEDGADQGQ